MYYSTVILQKQMLISLSYNLFYQDLVKAWISFNGAYIKPLSEKCILYNKNITISTINIISPGLFKSGLRFFSALFMEKSNLIPFKF